jgi:hypothetical protein
MDSSAIRAVKSYALKANLVLSIPFLVVGDESISKPLHVKSA